MRFTYSSGQRPLEGYTLKRGIGRGGFGEVYFAVSDGGKEVALKLLRDNTDIELRGVAQCLNLKHPNLVSLFDLRTDDHGDHWVVMEHVAGESLHIILGRHPGGLPVELAREWFLGLARAVAYLHDHGIVHRDLKPGNIFLEDGLLKVGDYGLSKAMSATRASTQTRSIGTVHYMAPEVSTGNYTKSIDVYAAGVILYEMLTGRVPFDGESAGEVLMKHLTAPPDLSALPPVFVPILARALSKDPAQRYIDMNEFASAVELTGRQSQPVPVERTSDPVPTTAPLPILTPVPSDVPSERPSSRVPPSALSELFGSMALAPLFALLAAAVWAALVQTSSLADVAAVFFLTVASSWAILVPTKFWTRPMEESISRRTVMMVLGLLVGVMALWVDGWTFDGGLRGRDVNLLPLEQGPVLPSLVQAASYLSYFALVFAAVRWWTMTHVRRSQRFGLLPILATGFWALVLLFLWRDLGHGAVALVLASTIVQLVSPWEAPPPPVARRVRLRHA